MWSAEPDDNSIDPRAFGPERPLEFWPSFVEIPLQKTFKLRVVLCGSGTITTHT